MGSKPKIFIVKELEQQMFSEPENTIPITAADFNGLKVADNNGVSLLQKLSFYGSFYNSVVRKDFKKLSGDSIDSLPSRLNDANCSVVNCFPVLYT